MTANIYPSANRNEQTSQTRRDMTLEEREAAQFAMAQYREFYGKGEFRYAIYPSWWKDSWGKAPLLGIVHADNEFLAERLAYDRGILPTPNNCTFQPKFKNLGESKKS